MSVSKQASAYIKTGTLKSKAKNINYFSELNMAQMWYGVLRETYRRYGTEIWAIAFFGSWALYIWVKLG